MSRELFWRSKNDILFPPPHAGEHSLHKAESQGTLSQRNNLLACSRVVWFARI